MANTSLSRTSVSTSNRKTWTFSMWFKRSGSGNSRQFVMRNITGGGTSYLDMELLSSTPDVLSLFNFNGSTVFEFKTNQVFRDFNGWYHIVYACDTTQATESDRFKMWVNGEQVTSFATATYPSQNADTDFLYADNLYLGTAGASLYFEGQMTHVHMIEGTAYDADTFGETDATTGIWKPKTAPSVTYGGEGCFLKFENSGAFGTDSSGNANNFTVNGTMTQTIDTPSNVFATFNPLDNYYANFTFSNGNTTMATDSSGYTFSTSTLGVSSGKYYVEAKFVSGSKLLFGATGKLSTSTTDTLGDQQDEIGYENTGRLRLNGVNTDPWGSSYSSGDILSIGLDLDNNKVYFGKNGTWQNSADPSAGTGGVSITSASSTSLGNYFFAFTDSNGSGSSTVSYNFGNGTFGTTAVSSAQNPDDGIGIFEYSPPTGYKALCTKSINAQEYD